MTWHTVAQLEELRPNQRKLCEVAGRRLALYRLGEEIVAIDNHCPHRGGPVGAGPLENGKLTCPWHGMSFELASGCTIEPSTFCLTRLPVRVLDHDVQVDLSLPTKEASGAIHRYLVRYGRPGHVGRFGSIEHIACQRGDRVLLVTDRGQETGEVLVDAQHFDPADTRPPAGELVRMLTTEEQVSLPQREAEEAGLLERAQHALAAKQASVIVLDAELTFDRQTLILYHPAEATITLGPLAAKLAETLALPRVQFESITSTSGNITAGAASPASKPTPEDTMRGPFERLKYDFRRIWECPACHHRERTPGSVTSLFCVCQAKEDPIKQLPMKLVDEGPRRTDGRVLPQRKSTLP
jgi:nitrite reductase/ring-hydroxylating ferredoxin subunit